MSDDETVNGYNIAYNKAVARELAEFEGDERSKRQHELDFAWQRKLDAEARRDDGMVDIGGFRERRTRYGFTKHWRDPDFDTH